MTTNSQLARALVAGLSDAASANLNPMVPTSHPATFPADRNVGETQTSIVGGGDARAQHPLEGQHPFSPSIAEIIQAARLRRRWHKAEKSLVLQGKAFCRAWADGDKTAANALFDKAVKGDGDPLLMMGLTPFLAAIDRFADEREAVEKELRKMARALPIWKAFALEVKGLGDLRLALIIGECGDIGGYRNPSCLWKRMGLAVINGERQRRKADAEEALEHGYNPERRAMAYVLETEILKAQIRAPKDDDGKHLEGEPTAIGPYGALYLERRALEMTRPEMTKAWAHNRAARFMAKRLFRDLFAAWQQLESAGTLDLEPNDPKPAAPAMPEPINPASSNHRIAVPCIANIPADHNPLVTH